MASKAKIPRTESTSIKPKVFVDDDGVFTVDFTGKEECSWIHFTEWTCVLPSRDHEITFTRGINEHICNMMRHFDSPPGVKMVRLRNPEQKVILVFGHDTEANAFNMFNKFTDVRNTVLSFLHDVKIHVEDMKVRVRRTGTNHSRRQQDQEDRCLFDPKPDYTEGEKSETKWFCMPNTPNLVVDNETSNSRFSQLKKDMRRFAGACLSRVSTGSVIFTFYHGSTEDALEMISKHEEVRAMILECLREIDSTVKDIQMEVQLQDFIDLSEPEGVHRQTGDAGKPKHTSGTVTDLRRQLADTRQELKATKERVHRFEISHQKGPVTEKKAGSQATPTPARTDARADADLRVACREGNLEKVKLILDTGRADVNSRHGVGRRGGRTPVMLAARGGHRDVVELLASRGADVSLVDVYGNNILHCACVSGDRETVEFVLSLDAVDVNARNNDGETAADVARGRGHRQLSDLLVSRGTQ